MAHADTSDLAYWLLLAKLDLAPPKVRALLECFGSPRGIFEASRQELALAIGRGTRLEARVRTVESSTDVADLMRRLRALECRVIVSGDPDYPPRLSSIYAPPSVLFVTGDVSCLADTCVAVVGTRRASAYGLRAAEELATGLARKGITVVSGLAVGIDSAAHRGALAGGGKTIGVLACGIDVCYPQTNRELREQIQASGAVVTEFTPGTPPRRWAFPQRNRIVSGLGLATVVVEAPERSGALITAELALEQGREVMAVPGEIHSGRSRGCHGLIRDGAALVETAEDVVRALGLVVSDTRQAPPQPGELSPPEQRTLAALSAEGASVEALVAASSLSAADVCSSLMLLEMKGHAKRLPGGHYVRG